MDTLGQPPASASRADTWTENRWREDAQRLDARVEQLERQLRRRTLALGSGVALMAGAAAGAVVASLPLPETRLEVATAPFAAAAAQPAAAAAFARAATVAPNPEPSPPERVLEKASHPEPGEPAAPTPRATAEFPSPPVPAEVPAAVGAGTPSLRAILSDIKQQLRSRPGDAAVTGDTPPRSRTAEPPLTVLPALGHDDAAPPERSDQPSRSPGVPAADLDGISAAQAPDHAALDYQMASFASLRSVPSSDGPVLGALDRGTAVRSVERRGDWLLVDGPGHPTGWVHRRFLRPADAGGQPSGTAARAER